MLLGGTSYTSGIRQTTLERAAGSAPVTSVLSDTWTWTGVILVLAIWRHYRQLPSRAAAPARPGCWLILAAAALARPLEQANLHTLDALNKHVGLGAWFAAIAAGYTVDPSSPPPPTAAPGR